MYNFRFSDVSIKIFLTLPTKTFTLNMSTCSVCRKVRRSSTLYAAYPWKTKLNIFFLCTFHYFRAVCCVLTGKQTMWCSKSSWSRWERRRAILTLREIQGMCCKNQATHCGWSYFDISWGRSDTTRRSDVSWIQCQSLI
jgi:hypothetical protein